MPIYMAQIGEEYLVKKIGGLEEAKHHLKNLGFVVGSQVSVISIMTGNLIIQIKDARVAISKELAGKTTLFNVLTGSNQFVGNWPGISVEKKSGKLKGHKDVEIMDLPGIYSLSPYTLEEVEAAVKMAAINKTTKYQHRFDSCVEHTLAHIEEAALYNLIEEKQRWMMMLNQLLQRNVISTLNLLLRHV